MNKERKDSLGKRAIHWTNGTAGVITKELKDSDHLNDTTVTIEWEGGTSTGHRHYFYIEGGNYPGDTFFDDSKYKYFKEVIA